MTTIYFRHFGLYTQQQMNQRTQNDRKTCYRLTRVNTITQKKEEKEASYDSTHGSRNVPQPDTILATRKRT